MSYKIFERLLKTAQTINVVDARNWFRQQAASITTNPQSIINTSPLTTTDTERVIGNLALFSYSPKHAETLPFFDRFPLIFPVDIDNEGFTGINFHYLDYQYRALLMDGLYRLQDKNGSITLTYKTLKSFSTLRYFRPCFKRYLNKHVTSKIVSIPQHHWDIALFLPLERFEKQNKRQVHANSKKIING